MVVSVDHSVHNRVLTTSYQWVCNSHVTCRQRGDASLKKEMAETILAVLPKIPGNLIIFFPSYGYMGDCVAEWKKDGTLDQMGALKEIQEETVGMTTKDFESIVTSLQNAVYRQGAILLAVCRGKASEGIDFSDAMCRCVIIVGIPYAPFTDLKISLRRQYLDKRAKQQEELNERLALASARGQDVLLVRRDDLPLASITNIHSAPLNGSEWYTISAHRAVNQSVGRVIRHKDDFGTILLMDERYTAISSIQRLSKWMQPFYRPMTTVGRDEREASCVADLVKDLGYFYARNMGKFVLPEKPAMLSRSNSTLSPFAQSLTASQESDTKATGKVKQGGGIFTKLKGIQNTHKKTLPVRSVSESDEGDQNKVIDAKRAEFISKLKPATTETEVQFTPKSKGIKRYFHSEEVKRPIQNGKGTFVFEHEKTKPSISRDLFGVKRKK